MTTATTQVISRVQQAATLALCKQSFSYFCSWLKIKGSEGGTGIQPFKLYDYQEQTATEWQAMFEAENLQGEVRLKGRQLGYSWLAAAFKLWAAMYHTNSDVGLWSKAEAEVVLQMRRVQFLHGTLPVFLQLPMDWKQREASFEGGSTIYAFPSTKDAGIGYTFRLAVQDEAAAHEYGEENFGNYQPALMDNGCIIIFSSASPELGPNGFFWDMYRAAQRGKIEFLTARFIPWWYRPPRFKYEDGEKVPDMAWYNRRKSSYVGRPEAFSAQYPFTDTEAFVGKAGLVFPNGPPVQINNTPWENWRWRIAGIDPGGGDPTAIIPIGITQDQHFHQVGEYYRREPVGLQQIYAYLGRLHDVAPFDFIAVDPSGSNRVLIETLQGMGLPAIPAINRRQGIEVVRTLHDEGRFTIDPDCTASIEEYEGYRWQSKRDPHSNSTYATSTPVDNHADGHDARRYALVTAWSQLPQHSQRTEEFRGGLVLH